MLVGLGWAYPAALFLVLFFILPLVYNGQRGLGGVIDPDAVGPYAKLLGDRFYLGVIAQTIALSLGVTIACVLLGYPIAWFLVRRPGWWTGILIFLLIAPQLTSVVMRTFGWRVLLARRGFVNVLLLDLGIIERPLDLLRGPMAAILSLIHIFVPFMVLSIAAVLQGVDRRLEESARILGAGRIQTFLRVTLPLSLDGIATGSILVFMLTNGSFVTLVLLGGGSLVTLPVLIYQQFVMTQDLGFITAMGNLLLVLSLICLWLQLRLIRRRGVATQ